MSRFSQFGVLSSSRLWIALSIMSPILAGCPQTDSISTDSAATTRTPSKPIAAEAGTTSQTNAGTVGPMGPAGPKGDPGTPAPTAFLADTTAPSGTVYVRPSQTVYAEGTYAPTTSSIPMTVIGGNTDIRLPTQTGIHSILHVNAATSYRGHDAGGAITMGRLDNPFASEGPSMLTRIATGLDIGNSHGSRLRLQTTKNGKGWNEGFTLWEDGSATLGYSWVNALGSPGASLAVKGVGNLPLLSLNAESDGASKVHVDASGKVGIGTSSPSAAFHLTTGETAQTTCNSWASSCVTVPSPMMLIGGGGQLKTNTGIHSLLHINAYTPYRGHDSGGAITMGTSWGFDTMNSSPSMKTRIATQTDVGNSHGARLKLQATKDVGGWNEGITLWENGTVTIGDSWLTAGRPGATLQVKGVSGTALMNLTSEADGSSKVLVDATGKVGIGVTPARSLHIGDAMRLQPIASPPSSPAVGDMYFDTSDALCVRVAAGWTKVAGAGTCD